MQEKSLLKLSFSQFKRLRVMPKWYVYAIIIIAILSVFGYMTYTIWHERELFKQQLNIYNEELSICKRNNDLYCLIGEYTLIGKTMVPADSLVYKFIKDAGAWYPDIVMAQWCIESTHGTSNIAVNANNHFGMRPAKTRATLQTEDKEYNGYGVYRNWQYSVIDRILWDLHVFDSVPTREVYLNKIKNIYAEDKNYIPKITAEAAKWKKLDIEKEENDTIIVKESN